MKNIKCVIRSDSKRKDNEHLIYLRYTYNRRFLLFNTGANVSIADWNSRVGRVRKSINYELKNLVLIQTERDLESMVLELMSQKKEPTLLNVKIEFYKAKNTYQSNVAKPMKHDEKKFLKDFKEFIQYQTENDKVKKQTLQTYNTTYNKLTEFQKTTSYFLHYDRINAEFYDKFLVFLRAQNLVDNSVDKHIKNLKLFMNYSLSKEKHNNNVFQTFKRTRTKADFVVLDTDELRKLYYDYKPITHREKEMRDTFVLGCTTGLRFGDLTRLTRGNFIIKRDKKTNEIMDSASDSYIRVPTQKTTELVNIPLNPLICELIEKYELDTKEPTFLKHNSQIFNREIKSICEIAGINRFVKVSKKKSSITIDTEGPKYKFISSHTMRRTFITILSSMTEITNIQAVSGHKDIKVLTEYIKRNDKELNSVRACFNGIFNRNTKEKQISQPVKVRATIIKSRIITQE